MKHDLHNLVNTNQSTQDDTLPATVASDISVAECYRGSNRRELMLIHVLSSLISVL